MDWLRYVVYCFAIWFVAAVYMYWAAEASSAMGGMGLALEIFVFFVTPPYILFCLVAGFLVWLVKRP